MTTLALSESSHLRFPGSVHVWSWKLDPGPYSCGESESLLSDEERERAQRFRVASHRQKFIVSHAAVRMILAGYFNCHLACIRYGYGQFGKPFVQNQSGGPLLHFSLSHTARLGALAISAENELGLDIEEIRPINPDVAKSLSRYEQSELAALQAKEWLPAFYRCWARKEAILKAEGIGLNLDSHSFDVSVAPLPKTRLLGSRNPAFTADWHLLSLEPAVDHVGAIAFPSDPTEIRYFCFDDPWGAA